MADLTEGEKKMLRERAALYGIRSEQDFERAVKFGSDLLLAAKEKVPSMLNEEAKHSAYAAELQSVIRNSDWGDLFKEKV